MFAWIVDLGYKKSPEYKAEHPPKQQAATTTSSSAQSVAATAPASAEDQKSQTTTPAKPKSVSHAHSPMVKTKGAYIHGFEKSTEPNCDYDSVITNNEFRNGGMPPSVPDKTLMDNNLIQGANPGSTGVITVEGKGATVTHNTIENVQHGEIHATKDADRAYIEK